MRRESFFLFFILIVLILNGCSEQAVDARGACNTFENLANKGDPYGDQSLAHCYRTGEGRKKDLLKAEELLQKASKAGRIEAKQDLASLYILTLDDPNKYKTAIALLYEALNAGHIKSLFVLGVAAKNGLGLEQNQLKAKDYFLSAANQGHNLSVFIQTMGYCYGAMQFVVNSDQCRMWKNRLSEINYFISETDFDQYVDNMLTSELLKKRVFSSQDINAIAQREQKN